MERCLPVVFAFEITRSVHELTNIDGSGIVMIAESILGESVAAARPLERFADRLKEAFAEGSGCEDRDVRRIAHDLRVGLNQVVSTAAADLGESSLGTTSSMPPGPSARSKVRIPSRWSISC